MKPVKILRNGIAGALIAALPVTATMGATRPNAAVPTASSTAVVAQDYDGDGGVSWLAIAAIGVAAAVALWLILDDDGDDEGALSPA